MYVTKELYRGGAFVYHEWDTSDGLALTEPQVDSPRSAGERPTLSERQV